ncbi:MAG TPA: hypothetical protein VNA25_25885 [Phycisphaerae bacterium]|nr:hypothetical protein [Phycisphaerae bacterium]
MSLSDEAIITLADFQALMGWGAGDHDEAVAQVEAIIEAVSASFHASVDCDLQEAVHTADALDGTGKTYLYLAHWPVTTFTSLTEDTVALTENTHFYVDYAYGILDRYPGTKWTSSRRGIVVTYTAGYEEIPFDIKQACLIECARAYEIARKKIWGEESRSVDGNSASINLDEFLPATVAVLAKYTRPRV